MTARANVRWGSGHLILIVTALLATVLAACVGPASPPGSQEPRSSAPPSTSDVSPPIASTPSPAATSAATGTPSSTPVPQVEGWVVKLEASATDTTQSVTHVVAMTDGRLLAAVEVRHTAEPPVTAAPDQHVEFYIGTDEATGWERVDTADTFTNVELTSLVATRDGSILAFGAYGTGTWSSEDGREWTPIESPVASGTVVVGGKGYVAALPTTEGGERAGASIVELYHSTDAREWQHVHTVGGGDREARLADISAGEEGFILFAYTSDASSNAMTWIHASGDGRTWVEATDPGTGGEVLPAQVAPLGGDWIAAAAGTFDRPDIPVWHSTNGLAWTQVATITDPNSRQRFGSAHTLSSAGGHLFLSTALAEEGAVSYPTGVWHSTDGTNWEMLPLGDEAEATAALATDCCFVLGGRVGHGGSPALVWYGAP